MRSSYKRREGNWEVGMGCGELGNWAVVKSDVVAELHVILNRFLKDQRR